VTLLAEARAIVLRVIALLEHPTLEALEESEIELAGAVGLIEQLRSQGPEPRHAAEIRELRQDLRRAGAMLRQAWAFRAGAGQAGYSRRGEITVDVAALNRIAIEG
jgi:hypothetical protein